MRSVPFPGQILETFLKWLEHKGVKSFVAVIKVSHRPSQERFLTTGCGKVQINTRRSKKTTEQKTSLKVFKKIIRLRSDKVQCQVMRKAIPCCLGRNRFVLDEIWDLSQFLRVSLPILVTNWKPGDLSLTSRQNVRDLAQKLLSQRH